MKKITFLSLAIHAISYALELTLLPVPRTGNPFEISAALVIIPWYTLLNSSIGMISLVVGLIGLIILFLRFLRSGK